VFAHFKPELFLPNRNSNSDAPSYGGAPISKTQISFKLNWDTCGKGVPKIWLGMIDLQHCGLFLAIPLRNGVADRTGFVDRNVGTGKPYGSPIQPAIEAMPDALT